MIDDLIIYARGENATDIHIGGGDVPAIRVGGEIRRLTDRIVNHEEIDTWLERVFDKDAAARLRKTGEFDGSLFKPELGTIRIHAFKEQYGPALAIRLQDREIPRFADLNYPPQLRKLIEKKVGLVYIDGLPNAGKSTLQHALAEELGKEPSVIADVADPVEFRHTGAKARFIALNVGPGRDTPSFTSGVRSLMRADPNVILIGENRGDADTVRALLDAAERALVIATGFGGDTSSAIDSILGVLPRDEQEFAAFRLARSLIGVIAMRLVPTRSGRRLPVCEILFSTPTVQVTIREQQTYKLRSIISSSGAEGMQTLEAALSNLVSLGEITEMTAKSLAAYPNEIRATAPMRPPSSSVGQR